MKKIEIYEHHFDNLVFIGNTIKLKKQPTPEEIFVLGIINHIMLTLNQTKEETSEEIREKWFVDYSQENAPLNKENKTEEKDYLQRKSNFYG